MRKDIEQAHVYMSIFVLACVFVPFFLSMQYDYVNFIYVTNVNKVCWNMWTYEHKAVCLNKRHLRDDETLLMTALWAQQGLRQQTTKHAYI